MSGAHSQPPFQSEFTPAEFAARRERVATAIGRGAVAFIQGASATGAFDLFRQTNEMFYLTGVEVPHAHLSIDGDTGRSTLYLPHRDEKLERSDGPQLNCDRPVEVRAITSIDDVRPLKSITAALVEAQTLLTPFNPAEGRQASQDTLRHARRLRGGDPFERESSREDDCRERLATANPRAAILDLSPLLDRLRLIKSPAELRVMRRAGRLAALAVREAMAATRAGRTEFQLAALADFIFQINGGRPGGGYRPIVACGKNIWNSHYFQNSATLKDGEWVLMDFAPDIANYTSDIGRYWPVNGRYTELQRQLYGFIVYYHQTLLKLIKPGVTPSEVMDAAAKMMEPIVQRTSWSSHSIKMAAWKTLSFRGHLSHSVGMAVHDAGDYTREPLRPGTVFALDPQMWVPEDELYVRVEDTVAVTEDGVEVLTAGAPLDLDEVEAWMRTASSDNRSFERQILDD